MSEKIQVLTYKCDKCGFRKDFLSNQQINDKCKVCGNKMMFFNSRKYNHKNGLNAVKNSNVKHSIDSQTKSNPVVECPYCHSTNTKKISGLSKASSVALFGVFAVGKVSKQWHCNNCGSDF